MQKGSDRGFGWMGLAMIATVARLPCRDDSREAHPQARRGPGQ